MVETPSVFRIRAFSADRVSTQTSSPATCQSGATLPPKYPQPTMSFATDNPCSITNLAHKT